MKACLILFDRMTSLDFFGFYDPVTRLKSMNIIPDFQWRLCATGRQVTDDRGACILAEAVAEPLGDYDLLFVPGGLGTRELQHDRKFIEWLSSAARVKLKTSVCTGALLLGAVGWLRDKRATTHPSAFDELVPYCAAVVDERVVDEGNVITARGVSASIDLGLHVVERLAGTEARARVARQMDYPYRWDTAAGMLPA
jgi:cyclohexyl-isocyanide hydratase